MKAITRQALKSVLLVALVALATGCTTGVTAAPANGPSASAAHSAPQPQDLVFRIPPGAAAAFLRGEAAPTVPDIIRITRDQGITIRNEDSAMHYFFYLPIPPGQTVRKTFEQPGAYGYSGVASCSIARLKSITVIVDSPTAGLE